MSNTGEKHITRVDYPDRHLQGYFVRLQRQGTIYREYFADTEYDGDSTLAFKAARLYRDTLLQLLPPVATTAPYRETAPANNTSGRVGVTQTFDRFRNGTKYPLYKATWVDKNGQRHCKNFVVHHYPDSATAFAAAVRYRAKKEQELQ